MKNKFFKMLLTSAVLVMSSFANAGLIIDTGSNAQGTGWNWSSGQNFSGRFTTTQDWNINSIEAFVSNTGAAGNFDVAIWSSVGNTPLATLFNATGSIAGGAQADWYGVFGLNELLLAGTYWVSVEPGTGVSGIHFGSAPNPLNAYNQRSSGNAWQWNFADPGQHLAIGFRIDATNPTDVPEPSTLAIFALGMIGLASRRFKKQS